MAGAAASRTIYDFCAMLCKSCHAQRATGTVVTMRGDTPTDVPTPDWTFLSNHSHVLVCIAQDPDVRVVEIARRVGIGERAVHRILRDLEEAGYATRTREGRRNRYSVHLDRTLRHPLEAAHRIADVLGPLTAPATTPGA